MQDSAVCNKYLVVKMKSGTLKKYVWDNVDFGMLFDYGSPRFFVNDIKGDRELIFGALLENIEYWERREEITHGNESTSN